MLQSIPKQENAKFMHEIVVPTGVFFQKMSACIIKMEWEIVNEIITLADPGFGQGGGPENFGRNFPDVASPNRLGSRGPP